MPHIPGHNRPFTSFLTQGMQNTNQNINSMNNPFGGSSNFNYQYDNPIGGFIDNEMGAPPDTWQPIDNEQYIGPGGFDVNGDGVVNALDIQAYNTLDWNPIEYQAAEYEYIEPQEEQGYWTEQIGGDYMNVGGFENFEDFGLDLAQQYGYNPNPMMQIDNPDTFSFHEFVQNYVNNFNWSTGGGSGAPIPPQPDMTQANIQQWIDTMDESDLAALQNQYYNNYEQDYIANPLIEAPSTQLPGTWQDFLLSNEDFLSEQEYAGQSLEDIYQSQMPYQTLVHSPSEYIVTSPATEGYNQEVSPEILANISPAEQLGYTGGPNQAFLDNLIQTVNPMQSMAPQFRGGGGQAGQAARQLYYPSTSGGFAGVGSGINPDMLKDIINRG